MITNETVPYTDKNGYRHIGGFPYGANLVVMKNGDMLDSTNYLQKQESEIRAQVDAAPSTNSTESTVSNTNVQTPPNAMSTSGAPEQTKNEHPEVTVAQNQQAVDTKTADSDNLTANPSYFVAPKFTTAPASSTAVPMPAAVYAQLNAAPASAQSNVPASNPNRPRLTQITQ
jgi:hypothetical protein